MDVNSVDGNAFFASSTRYTVISTVENNLLYRLQTLFPSQINPDGSLIATTFLAAFIVMLAIAGIAVAGVHSPPILGIVSLGMLGIFTFLGWIDVLVFGWVAMAGIFLTLAATAVIGS